MPGQQYHRLVARTGAGGLGIDPCPAVTVSREFLGLSRPFCATLAGAEVGTTRLMSQLAMPLPSLVRNGGVPRPAMLERTAAAWRDRIPATGRMSLEVVVKQKSLHISEIRAMCADTRFDDWEQDQTRVIRF